MYRHLFVVIFLFTATSVYAAEKPPTQVSAAEAAQNDNTFAKLDQPLKLSIEDKPLSEALKSFATAAGLNVTQLPTPALDTHLSLSVSHGTPARLVLRFMLSQSEAQLDYTVQSGKLIVGPADTITSDPYITVRSHSVKDLVYPPGPVKFDPAKPARLHDDQMRDLKNLIQTSVSPDSWREVGGTVGTIAEKTDSFLIRASEPNHHQIARLFDLFRRPVEPIQDPFVTKVNSKANNGPFDSVALRLAGDSGFDLLIDARLLKNAGFDLHANAAVAAANRVPFGDLLRTFFRQVDPDNKAHLNFSAIANTTILLSTEDANNSSDCCILRIYNLLDIPSERKLPYDQRVLRVLDTMKSRVDPTSWRDVGKLGTIFEYEGKLLIMQAIPNHKAIEEFLKDPKLPPPPK